MIIIGMILLMFFSGIITAGWISLYSTVRKHGCNTDSIVFFFYQVVVSILLIGFLSGVMH